MPDTIASLLALDIPNFLPESPGFLRPAGPADLVRRCVLVDRHRDRLRRGRADRSGPAEPATWAATIVGALACVGDDDARVRRRGRTSG